MECIQFCSVIDLLSFVDLLFYHFIFIYLQVVKLSEPAEEVATFYARMLDHEYTSKEQFNTNFWKDWRKVGGTSVLGTWY